MEALDTPSETQFPNEDSNNTKFGIKVFCALSGFPLIVILILYLRRLRKQKITHYTMNANKTELIYQNKYKVIINKSGEVQTVSIVDMYEISNRPFCCLEIVNNQLFDLEKFGDFLDSLYWSKEYSPNYRGKAVAYDATVPFLQFYRTNTDVPSSNMLQIPVDIKTLVDFGEKSLKDFVGTNFALSVDNGADGNCLYYSILYCLSNQLRDPNSSIYKRIFNLESKTKDGLIAKIYGFDEIRLAAILAIHKTKHHHRMSKYQLFALVFYFKMLICTEIIDNLEKYEPFICDMMPEYQPCDFLSNYYKMNREIEPSVISEMLNYELKIINVVSGGDKYINPEIYLRMDETKAYDGVIYLLYINNNHYRAIIRFES